MTTAAQAWLASLDETQAATATIDFANEQQRTDWHYIPRERAGLPLRDMSDEQRRLAFDLVASGLSARGLDTARTIIGLETILAGLEGPDRNHPRDPQLYYLSLFGSVGGDVWGWRFEGHHVSLNNTIVDGALSVAPLFFGSNPAHVRHGEHEGLRALQQEEDLARDLLSQLDGQQQQVAIVASEAPPDILTTNVVRVGDEAPATGLAATDMTTGQRELLRALVDVYVSRLPEPLAETEWQRLAGNDLAQACFAWAGTVERGGPHYYRVHGGLFLAEYDNTQNDANHIHAVWRDLTNDFGEDILRRHYDQQH